jgi:hypothetical protein
VLCCQVQAGDDWQAGSKKASAVIVLEREGFWRGGFGGGGCGEGGVGGAGGVDLGPTPRV